MIYARSSRLSPKDVGLALCVEPRYRAVSTYRTYKLVVRGRRRITSMVDARPNSQRVARLDLPTSQSHRKTLRA